MEKKPRTPAQLANDKKFVQAGIDFRKKDNYEQVRKAARRRIAGDKPKGLTKEEWNEVYEKEASERKELTAKIQVKKALRRRAYNENPFEIIRDGILSIKTKQHGIRPLDVNEKYAQLKILDWVEEDWYAERPIRGIICKSRRQGVSTIIEAIFYVLVGKLIGINALIVSDDQEGSNYLTDITRLYHTKLKEYDPYIMPNFERDNPKKLKFENKNSEIRIDTARNPALGRKYTYHLAHLSEVAFFLIQVEIMMLGLKQTISDMPYTIVMLESTSNGIGNYYHRNWIRAEQKISSYKAVFFSRYEDPDNRKAFSSEEKKELLLHSLNAEEKEDWFNLNKMYPPQEIAERLNWRRYCIEDQCDGSLDLFHQEYPKTADESFLVSGRTRFDKKALKQMKDYAEKRTYLKRGTFINGKWEDHENGDITVWKTPVLGGETINNRIQASHKYVCGVDVMRGKLVAESTREPDFNDVQIIDAATMEQVCEIHNRDEAPVLGEKVLRMCRWYNMALLGIENNQGQGLIQHVKKHNYFKLYMSTHYDQILKKETKAIGWNKNQKTQILMETDLASAIRDYILVVNDIFTIYELFTYVIDDEGKAAAQEGCWDDRVIALGIAVLLLQHVFLEKDKEIPAEEIPNTWAWHRKRIHEERDKRQKRGWMN